ERPRGEALLALVRDAVGGGALARRHDLAQLHADVVDADVVVRGDAAREAVRVELRVDGAAAFLAVVVRSRAPGEKAETVHRGKFGPERIRDAVLVPADHPGAEAGEQDARLPRLAQDLVEPVQAPDRER